MKRAGWLKIINLLLAIDLVFIATTAILHDLIEPLGFYSRIHPPAGYIFVLLITSHLVLNRGWIKSTYFKKKTSRA